MDITGEWIIIETWVMINSYNWTIYGILLLIVTICMIAKHIIIWGVPKNGGTP